MSFFSWFSGKSSQAPNLAHVQKSRAVAGSERVLATAPPQIAKDSAIGLDNTKFKRHTAREQLYVAIREAMTRAGVLSASYKFKVLSLDRQGSEFLVMIDLTRVEGDVFPQPHDVETLVVRNAKVRFDITVPAVYWRVHVVHGTIRSTPQALAGTAMAMPAVTEACLPHEPIQPSEIAAFQTALLGGGSPHHLEIKPERETKHRNRSFARAHPREFEDTEVLESVYSRPLSITQYGDLN